MRILTHLLAFVMLAGTLGCAFNKATVDKAATRTGHFKKGMMESSAGGSAGIHDVSNEIVDSRLTISLGPLYGYFITDKLEVLGAFGIEYEETKYKDSISPLALDYSRQSNYSLAAGLQYNFDSAADVIPYAKVFAGLMESRIVMKQINIPFIGTAKDRRRTTDPFFGFRAGLRYFVAKNVSCDMGLGFQRVFYDDDFGENTDDWSIKIGFAFFF